MILRFHDSMNGPIIHAQKNILVVTYLLTRVSLFLLGPKIKLKGYKDQHFDLESEKYLAAIELLLAFVILSVIAFHGIWVCTTVNF